MNIRNDSNFKIITLEEWAINCELQYHYCDSFTSIYYRITEFNQTIIISKLKMLDNFFIEK